MTALFSANKGEWFTPPEIIKRVHAVMGGIDLDPASCAKANEIVGAKQFFTATDDALNRPWHGRVFVNPPGTCVTDPTKVEIVTDKEGKQKRKQLDGYFTVCGNAGVCSCDLPRKFWEKTLLEYQSGNIPVAQYLGFSLNQLATLQGEPTTSAFCYCDVNQHAYYCPRCKFNERCSKRCECKCHCPARIIKSPLDFPICILKQRLKFLDSETLEPVPGPTQHNFVSYINGTGMKFRAEFQSLGACK